MFSQNYLNQLQKNAQDKGGGSSLDICDCKRNYFKSEPDKYVDLVIIPYRAGAGNPLVRKRVIAQGEWVFSLDLLVHTKIGVDKKNYICLQTWGERCPLCDLQYKIFKEQGKEAAKSLRNTKRSYLNIALCDQQGSRYGELQVFNPSYVLFTEKLLDAAIAKNRGMGITPFADVDKGSVVSFHTIQEVIGTTKFVDYASFDFGMRAVPIPQDFVRNAICFEDHLRMPDINEMQDLSRDGSSWQIQPRSAEPDRGSPTSYAPQTNQPAQITNTAPAYNPASQQDYTPEPRPAQPVQPAQVNYAQQPLQQEAEIICPSGLRFGVDCNSQRACHYCEVWDSCDRRNKMAG
jgi:hypothetical protein